MFSILSTVSVHHRIPLTELGPAGEGMARAVSTCVHCGFCLAACPTYKVLGEEMDSPRGRILLMKGALEGDLSDAEVAPYIDRCLGCLACETSCPSGVRYRELLTPFRARLERGRHRTMHWSRELLLTTLESPTLFRAAAAAGRLARPLSPLLPETLRTMIMKLPSRVPPPESLPEFTPAVAPRRARVALLAGCVQRAVRPSVNSATVRVLAANGVDVLVPSDQGCCGALALHAGLADRGRALSEHNVRVFPADVDAIITNTAGCGSAMQEQPYRAPVRDVTHFLDALGLRGTLRLSAPTRVAYHDACHLSHGQGVRDAPRRLLASINGLDFAELADGEMCCGSAGLYNLEQPTTADALGRRKAAAIEATGAAWVASGNIGCLMQIQSYLSQPVFHTIEILDLAYSASNRTDYP